MNAEETRLIAGRWLERSQRPDWSAEDQLALNQWLADPKNMVAYLRIESVWQSTDRLTVLRRPRPQEPMRAPKQVCYNLSIFRRVAAIILFAAIVGAVTYQKLLLPTEIMHVTGIGEYKSLTFKDGTRVELNSDTVLRVSQRGIERKAWLDKGEAYFEVEHDPTRPYIVITNGRKITDLGTKFAIRQDVGKLRVAVVEGLVEVEAKGEKPQSLLKPGDILTATASQQSVIQKPLQAILAGLNWKQGKIFLDYATLAEAAAEFNRYNSRKLVIHDPELAELTVVGTFRARDPAAFTKVMKEIFGLRVETRNNEIILSR